MVMGKSGRCMGALLLALAVGGLTVRGETIKGRVLTEDGSAAKGARVWVAKLWIQHLERVETQADDQGRFSVEVGPGQWLIDASKGEQGLANQEFAEVAKGKELAPASLRLSAQGTLRCRLIEAETGKPIVGGRLVVDNGLDPVTDQDGRFELPALSRTRYHEAFVVAPGRERKRVLFEMSEKPVTDLDVFVKRGGKAVGRVLDAEGGPIVGAFVGKSTSGSILSLTGLWVRTDDQGHFEYDGLVLDRTTWLNANAPGFTDNRRDGVRADEAGRPQSIEFRLARNPAAPAQTPGEAPKADEAPAKAANRRNISGLVVDPDGKAVANAKVRWGLNQSSDGIEAKTDSSGKFRLALVPDAPESVCVIPADGLLAPGISAIEKPGDQEIRVELAKGHGANGVVRDEIGTPFSGVMVLPVVSKPGLRDLALWERHTKTDAQGRFEVSGLPESGTTFTFLGSNVSDLRDHRMDLDKESVVTMSAAGAIRGKVVDPEGKPVRNFRVLLNVSRERDPTDKFGGFFAGFCGIGLTYSSDDGSFLIRNLGSGTIQRVTVLAPGYGERSLDRVMAEPLNHLAPDKAITFEVKRPNALKVRVTAKDTGKPVPDARVSLIYDDPSIDKNFTWGYHDTAWGDSVHARTGAEGIADFSPLTFGEGTLLVQCEGYARLHRGWRDASQEVAVELEPGAGIVGELTDASDGKPLAGVYARLHSPTGDQISTLVSEADKGSFKLGELPGGSYTFSVTTHSGVALHNERVELKPGETVSRVLKLSASGEALAKVVQEQSAQALKAPEKRFKIGDRAPEFASKTLDDKLVSLKDYRGKYVLLDFWATWCGPCIGEVPHLRAAYDAFGKDPKFAMISLSVDANKNDVAEFLKDKDQPWTQVFLGDWSSDPVTKEYGVHGIPAIFLLDPDGKIVAQDLRGEGIKKAVAKVLEHD